MLSDVTIPPNVIFLGDKAFSNCKSLTSMTIPENVTFIGSYVFAGCSSLTNLSVPERFMHLIDDLTCDVELEDDLDVDMDVG